MKNRTERRIYGYLTIEIGFPVGRAVCVNCPLCRYESPFRRYCCAALPGRVLDAPFSGRDQSCPIRFDDEEGR